MLGLRIARRFGIRGLSAYDDGDRCRRGRRRRLPGEAQRAAVGAARCAPSSGTPRGSVTGLVVTWHPRRSIPMLATIMHCSLAVRVVLR